MLLLSHGLTRSLLSGLSCLLSASSTLAASAAALPDLHKQTTEAVMTPAALAQNLKNLGETLQGQQNKTVLLHTRQWAWEKLRHFSTRYVAQTIESMFAHWGELQLNFDLNDEGELINTRSQLWVPWRLDETHQLFTQSRITQLADNVQSNTGIGCRWRRAGWNFGYNLFYDTLFNGAGKRGSAGMEVQGDYLALNMNYYFPLSAHAWRDPASVTYRPAPGFDLRGQGFLPFFHHLSGILSYQRYRGAAVDFLHNGSTMHNPAQLMLSLNYTPVPLVTLSLQHNRRSGLDEQHGVSLQLHYRFGVPFRQQLQASQVARTTVAARSFDAPVLRNDQPVWRK